MVKKNSQRLKGELEGKQTHLDLSAIGLEAEFTVFIDEEHVEPEQVFADPTGFVRTPLLHRVGTSYHLPTGGAVYFDTGVIEIATPVIEIAPACGARAGRSLWESIRFVRNELDAWEEQTGRRVRLAGFSAHYNISFENGPGTVDRAPRTVDDLALLLVHILPVPVMLLAANPRSTGIGVRPRGERIEVTADFTPSPALMVAAATFITAVAREVMRDPAYHLGWLNEPGVPVIDGFSPIPHTTRNGWLARWDCYSANPFRTAPSESSWRIVGSDHPLSLREIGKEIYEAFRPAVRRISDPFTRRLLDSVFLRKAPVLLDLPDRPAAYDDVGNLCFWDDLFPEGSLTRSLYERVLIRAIAGDVLELSGRRYVPVGMRGWSEVVFERLPERTRQRFSVDFLSSQLDQWEGGRSARSARGRRSRGGPPKRRARRISGTPGTRDSP